MISVRIEWEPIEVTRIGLLPPYEVDYVRKFIPGPATVWVTKDGEELPPMSMQEYKDWEALNLSGHPDA